MKDLRQTFSGLKKITVVNQLFSDEEEGDRRKRAVNSNQLISPYVKWIETFLSLNCNQW